MNQDVLHGKWKVLRGGFKKQWGKLTDDDVRRIQGSLDQVIGIIQQRYGYTRERAEQEIGTFLDTYQGYNDEVQAKVRSAISDVSDKVHVPFVKKKKSNRRRWLVAVGGLILSALVAFWFNQQQSTNHSPGNDDYRTGI